ncbi:hypothetical protein ACOMHN_059266 [Nucella lapillus]
MEGVGLLFETETRSTIQCVVLCMGTPACIAVTVTPSSSSSSSSSPALSMCRGHVNVTSASASTSTSASASAPVSASVVVWSLPHTEWLEKNCSSDAECGEYHRECFAGSCLCSPGYYFSHSINSCVTGCAKADLQSRLLPYPNRFIHNLNLGTCLNGISPEACLAICRQNADARTCDLLDNAAGSYTCCLQGVTRSDISASEWGVRAGIHYQKTCA